MQHIVRFEAENVQRIKIARGELKPGVNVVAGANGQGKSSLMNAIAYALSDKRGQVAEPVRAGEKTAQVLLELSDMTVRRRWLKSGGQEIVIESDGARLTSPAAVLERLVGHMLDPLAFDRADTKRQAELLLSTIGIDYTEIDGKIEAAMGQRRDFNRDLKALDARLEKRPSVNDDLARVDLAEIQARQREAGQHNARVARLARERDDLAVKVETLRKQLAAAEEAHAKCVLDLEAAGDTIDTSEMDEQIRKAVDINRACDARDETKAMMDERHDVARKAQFYDAEIENLREKKKAMLDEADLPLAGLSVEDGVVHYNGIPLSQCAASERFKVSCAIGMARRTTEQQQIRVMLVQDASLLDEASMKVLAEMAEAHDYQVVCERVGASTDGYVGVILEDGEIREAVSPE